MKHSAVPSMILGLLFQFGCSSGLTAPLEMTTLNPGDDHQTIARHYLHEASLSRQQVDELSNQAAAYEPLFGQESDWVSGTRLLVQFYQDLAREQDRLAELHMNLGKDRSSKHAAPLRDH
ncbi:MAG: hypothetical protein QM706_13905 [Nitrospira sp.]